MLPKFLYIVFFFLISSAISQNYHSEIEEVVFEAFQKDSLNYDFIESLSVIDSEVGTEAIDKFKKKLDTFVKNAPAKESKESREKKRVKKVYNLAHKTFFKKYEEVAFFPQIFEDGVYNCVTATALYAYLFDELGIPYHVKDSPSHVFLIAYPETLKIQLETTAPGSYGFLAPKESEIKETVGSLVELKLVTKDEVNSKGYKTIYTEYFFGEDHMDKAGLVGMQYYNKAIQNISSEAYKDAHNNIKKSLIFYPYPYSEFISKQLSSLNLDALELNTEDDIESLYTSFSSFTFGKELTKSEVDYFLYKIVRHDENELGFIEKATSKLSSFEDSTLNNHIKEFMYDYIASKYADQGNLDEAIRASDSLLSVQPKSKKAKEVILFAVNKKGYLMTKTAESYKIFNGFYEKYLFLEGDINIETQKTSLAGQIAMNFYRNKDVEKGKEFREIVERQLDKYQEKIQVNPDAVSDLFLFAGRQYYGKSQFKKALEIFEKGLSYNPSNADLKKMVKWAQEDLNR